ncbi:MAG: TPM domain-containing protein [Spirochaetaceae bacterium]|nr:TPM domain-containing protein [Spirochaetaceae bacterium]
MIKNSKNKIMPYSNAIDPRMNIKYSAKIALLITIFILQTLFLQAQSNNLPLPMGYASDYAGIISNDSKYAIEALGKEVKEKSGAEIAILTIKTIEPYASIEEYANEIMSKWGIGEKGKDTGVLIVLSIDEKVIRIEVGYGLEGAITDGLAGSIMDKYMIPYFRNNDFSTGLLEGYRAVSVVVAKEYNFEISGLDGRQYNNNEANFSFEFLVSLGFFILISMFGGRFFWLLFFLPSFGRTRRGFGRGFDGGSSGFGGGFSRGSGFGGGFSGFGGGFSGGGGASRRF